MKFMNIGTVKAGLAVSIGIALYYGVLKSYVDSFFTS